MVATRSAQFALDGWDFAASESRLPAFLARLGRPDITTSYRRYGGLALSRELAQQYLVDGAHFSGVATAWSLRSMLRLPMGAGRVVLEPSMEDTHWLRSQHSPSSRVFSRDQRDAMLTHMIEDGCPLWLVRQFIPGTPAVLDIGFSPLVGEPIMKVTLQNGVVAALVTLRGELVQTLDDFDFPQAEEVAAYLAHVLPSMNITFGVRVRCVLSSNNWYALDLHPSPVAVRAYAATF